GRLRRDDHDAGRGPGTESPGAARPPAPRRRGRRHAVRAPAADAHEAQAQDGGGVRDAGALGRPAAAQRVGERRAFGNVRAFISSFSPMIPLRLSRYAVTAYTSSSLSDCGWRYGIERRT